MTFTVRVLQNVSGTPPIQGANVNAVNQGTGTAYTGITNSLGNASINAPDGPYKLTVSANGYITQTTDSINFGDGGGYIMALTPTSPPPPPPPPPPAADDLGRIVVSTIIPIVAGLLTIKAIR